MTRVKAGIPTVSELVEGETEYRQVSGQGVISYTKNDNRLYSTRTYPTPIPPVIDKKESSSISNIVNISSTTGELELDFSALSSATLANGDFLMFLDTTSSYAVRKEAIADVATLFAGTGLDASSSVLNVNLTDAAETAIANGDYITFFDGGSTGTLKKEAIADVATLFSGTGLTATNSVIAVDASQTQITSVGTIGTGTWEGTTIAVAQGGTGATTLNNLITLGTHTTGNYVATLTAGTLIDLQNNSGETASPTVDVDLNEAAAATMVAGDGIIFVDADDSNVAKQETLSDLLDTVAGTVATTGLDRSGATLVITDLHPVGVDGANNQLLTDDGDGTVTSESQLSFDGDVLAITGTGTAKGNKDILTITNDVNAADMDGTETSILFNQWYYDGSSPAVADAGRISIVTENDWTSTTSTQDSYMAFETALNGTVTEMARITSAGNVGINVTDPDVKLEVLSTSTQQKWSYDADSYATISVSGTSSVTLANAESGDFSLDIAADIIFNADGGNIVFMDNTQIALNIDMDDTVGDAVFKDAGGAEIFRIDGSANSLTIRGAYMSDFAINIEPNSSGRHYASGDADYKENYSMHGIHDLQSGSFDADFGTTNNSWSL